ncbi:lysophospholipid acyltransferase family protein [Candidatus Endolissoclinum faulkneri]|uniref:lysophospholipid acyltransferase family protein n=1 Tax=Candidatus Endolissoclinum faulkneri TaxID=1263979 RepID=UPI00130E9389|nr:lysophospholipid acyltransferase family protein [Candidatus Endolissoclinum faulkneri]
MTVPISILFYRGDDGRYARQVSRVWSRGTTWLLAMICGLRYRVEGSENIPNRPAFLACKHQSAFETFVMNIIVPDLCIAYKSELNSVPIFGWFLRHSKMMSVNRNGGASALRNMMAQARAESNKGRYVLIFPEGTRVAVGEYGNAHVGIVAMVRDLKLPVVPISLNSGLYWPRKSFLRYPGEIIIRFMPVIEYVDKFGKKDLEDLIKIIGYESCRLCSIEQH